MRFCHKSSSSVILTILHCTVLYRFAYGQTGCGKTFTMEGVRNTHDPQLRGIIPTTFTQIFDAIQQHGVTNSSLQYLVRVSYIEIYNEQVRDLMSNNPKQKLDIKEDVDKGIYIKNLIQTTVTTVAQIHELMDHGNRNRSTGATLMNADSSRSHSIFTITIESSEYDTVTNETKIRAGKLNLVDLAGSERQSKTQATGVRLKEATKINLSLSALGNVISSLVSNAQGKIVHVPYRDSKLTRLLQDSLGGNTKTVMIAAISPADYNYDETLSTLRYANRAKNIKNQPKINEDPKDALLREYQSEISRLKAMLAQQGIDINSSQQQQNNNSNQPASGTQIINNLQSNSNNNSSNSNTQSLMSAKSQQLLDDNTALIMSPEEQHQLHEQRIDVQNEIQRIAYEKKKHEQLVEQLQSQLNNDKYESERLNTVQHEISEQLVIERQHNNIDNINQLLQQQQQLTVEQQTIHELTQRIESEKLRHEQLSHDLACEMDIKLQVEQSIQQQLQQQLIELTGKTYDEKQLLKAKLYKLQQKVMTGGQKILDLQNEHYNQLSMKEIESKSILNSKLAVEHEKIRLESEKLQLNQQYESKQSEIVGLTQKLQKSKQQYSELKSDLEEYTIEWNSEKESYLSNIRDIYRELRLYKLITETVLSKTDVDTIVKNSIYDEDNELWTIPKINIPVLFPTIGNKLTHTTANNNVMNSNRSVATGHTNINTAQPDSNTAADKHWKRSVIANVTDNTNTANTNANNRYNTTYQPQYRAPTTSLSASTTNNTTQSASISTAPVDIAAVTSDIPKRAVFTPSTQSTTTDGTTYVEPVASRSTHSRVSTNIDFINNIDVKSRPVFNPTQSTINTSNDDTTNNNNTVTDKSLSINEPPRRTTFTPATNNNTNTLSTNNNNKSTPVPADPLNISVPARQTFTPASLPTANTSSLNNTSNGKSDSNTNDILHKLPASRPAFTPGSTAG